MKIARTVIGIVSIVLVLIILVQSCAATVLDSLAGGSRGPMGILVAICILVAGILCIAARDSKGGSITCGCFYVFGALIGFIGSGNFGDLLVYGILALAFGVVIFVDTFKNLV